MHNSYGMFYVLPYTIYTRRYNAVAILWWVYIFFLFLFSLYFLTFLVFSLFFLFHISFLCVYFSFTFFSFSSFYAQTATSAFIITKKNIIYIFSYIYVCMYRCSSINILYHQCSDKFIVEDFIVQLCVYWGRDWIVEFWLQISFNEQKISTRFYCLGSQNFKSIGHLS